MNEAIGPEEPDVRDSAQLQPMKFGERRIGHVNWLGLWTLYSKEVRRFLKVWMQTVAAPAINASLFLLIFALVLGGRGRVSGDMPYEQFLAPGLMVMSLIQNAFANTSSSLIIGKVQGTILDVLMPPLSPGELTFGYAFGGVTRGVILAATTGVVFYLIPLDTIAIHNWWVILYFALAASVMLALAGILTGIWAEKFDHVATITNFVIVPFSLLSGTFYSIDRLPETMQMISKFNPFFYMIDGFRYGFIGRSDSDLAIGVAITLGVNVFLWLIVLRVFKTGWKIKD